MILSKVSQLARGRASFQTQVVKDPLLATMTCCLPLVLHLLTTLS